MSGACICMVGGKSTAGESVYGGERFARIDCPAWHHLPAVGNVMPDGSHKRGPAYDHEWRAPVSPTASTLPAPPSEPAREASNVGPCPACNQPLGSTVNCHNCTAARAAVDEATKRVWAGALKPGPRLRDKLRSVKP